MFNSSWDPDRFGCNLASRLEETLTGALDMDRVASWAALCAEAAEEACKGRDSACRAGCPHCCVLNVAVLLPEAAVIAKWHTLNLDSGEIGILSERLASHNSWARWMDDDERISRRAFCPFLDEIARCSIHPVRPLACRGVVSLDSDRCKEAFSPIISDQERGVPADLMRRGAFDMAFATLGKALKKRGIDDRSIELGTGVLAFLNEPKRIEDLLTGKKLPRELWG